MKACSLLLDQVCGGKDGANKRAGGNHCIRVFNDVKGHYLWSSRADGNIKLSGTSSRFGHSSAPANTMGNWTQCKCRGANSSVFVPSLQRAMDIISNASVESPAQGWQQSRAGSWMRGQKDDTEQMWDIKWDSPVDEGRTLCFMAAVFVANSLALNVSLVVHAAELSPCLLFFFPPLQLRKFESGARRKVSTFCSWQCFPDQWGWG